MACTARPTWQERGTGAKRGTPRRIVIQAEDRLIRLKLVASDVALVVVGSLDVLAKERASTGALLPRADAIPVFPPVHVMTEVSRMLDKATDHRHCRFQELA